MVALGRMSVPCGPPDDQIHHLKLPKGDLERKPDVIVEIVRERTKVVIGGGNEIGLVELLKLGHPRVVVRMMEEDGVPVEIMEHWW